MKGFEYSVFQILRRSTAPLKAREIASKLSEQRNGITTTDVNRVLYGDVLGKMLECDSAYAWRVKQPYQSMEANILALLFRHGPSTARELAQRLTEQFGGDVSTTDVNRFLYGEHLKALVEQLADHRWRAMGSSR